MKDLILLTDHYPFGTGEPFLENEIPYLNDNFRLTIISSDVSSIQTRAIPVGARVYRVSEVGEFGFTVIEKIRNTVRFFLSVSGWKEIIYIVIGKKHVFKRLKTSLQFYSMSQHFYKGLSGIVQENTDLLIYSYWSNAKLLSCINHKKNGWKIVTRMHGYDLYNERIDTGRQPFKKQMDNSISCVLFVSVAGLNYYKDNYGTNDDSKLKVCRLGTNEPRSFPRRLENHFFTICSCSNVIPIKHVELIVEALKQIKDLHIKWIHFGDGSNFKEIQKKTLELPNNIECALKGRVRNSEVIDYYSKNYIDCFITTSETEGCPVSIMEALSYGMPIIATSVGGIPEMLENTNNFLLPKHPTAEMVAIAIKRMYEMDQANIEELREKNRMRWREDFNSDKNNKKLVELLSNI